MSSLIECPETTPVPDTSIGKMFGKKSLFFYSEVGTASGVDSEYTLLLINNSIPAIRNEKTGKTFAFDWEKLLSIAKLNGIDFPE